MILVVAPEADDHAAAVLTELSAAGHPFERFDLADFPRNASVVEAFGPCLSFGLYARGRLIDLNGCGAAWWRRPHPMVLHDGLAADAIDFVYGECQEAIGGLWPCLPAAWVNPPDRDAVAHRKPYQLSVAAAVGLSVPRTLVTNDADAARRFIAEVGIERTVYKTFLATPQCWRETRVLRPHELDLLDTLRYAPTIFQEYVPAQADLRVTIIGPSLFAAAIRAAPDGYTIDYRMDMDSAHFEPTTLPPQTEEQLRELMRRLGLLYGAIDLRRTPDGQHVFLEINPAGEWRFVEERTDQSMTRAMASLLRELDRPCLTRAQAAAQAFE